MTTLDRADVLLAHPFLLANDAKQLERMRPYPPLGTLYAAGNLRAHGYSVALFDATLMGSAKDGAVFAIDRFVFQNNDLEPAHEVRYEDIVHVEKKRSLLRGAKIYMDINRGRATFALTLDFSGKPDAMGFLYRFLHEAMVLPVAPRPEPVPPGHHTVAGSDLHAVRQALDKLRVQGLLAETDYQRMLDVLQ